MKIDSLQCLRGLAAMSVVFFHFGLSVPLWSENSTLFTSTIISKGYLGVDIFFVISGFILAWIGILSRENPAPPVEFAVKRFFRIAPSYWVSMIFIAYLVSRPDPAGIDLLKMMLFFPLGNLHAPYYSMLMNDVGWTLGYEIAFYLIFCVGLIFGRFAIVATVSIILFFVVVLPIFGGVAPSFDSSRDTPFDFIYLRLLTNPLMLEFIPGIAAAWAYCKYRNKSPYWIDWSLLILGSLLLLCGFLTVDRSKGFSFFGAALPTGFIILGAALLEYKGLIKFPKFLVWLGDVSFALYLTHWALKWGVFEKYFPVPISFVSVYGGIFVKISFALALSYMWKRYVEDPTAKWGGYIINSYAFIKNFIINNRKPKLDANVTSSPAEIASGVCRSELVATALVEQRR